MKKISVIVPIYNEEEVINELYNRLSKVLQALNSYTYEIVLVDDGSNEE